MLFNIYFYSFWLPDWTSAQISMLHCWHAVPQGWYTVIYCCVLSSPQKLILRQVVYSEGDPRITVRRLGKSARKQQINAVYWLLCSWETREHNWGNLECNVSGFGVISAYWINRMSGCQPDFRLPLLKALLKHWNLPHLQPVLFLTYGSHTEE